MRVCLLAALLLAFMSPLVTADLIDPLDNTNNFNTGFNGATVVNNNDSTVSIVRNGTPTDTGIDWLRNGNSLLVLSTESFVTIVPGDDPDANTGTYSVSIQMFDSSGTFVEEAAWISQTGSIAPHSLDVATLATNSSS